MDNYKKLPKAEIQQQSFGGGLICHKKRCKMTILSFKKRTLHQNIFIKGRNEELKFVINYKN